MHCSNTQKKFLSLTSPHSAKERDTTTDVIDEAEHFYTRILPEILVDGKIYYSYSY